ncbi:MAG: trypsin-like peptidase domain-containing protein [Planctomycetes bacterium]|nr:trypsin-like peptidase domain-containing protein [Planctomycetota bacterium]
MNGRQWLYMLVLILFFVVAGFRVAAILEPIDIQKEMVQAAQKVTPAVVNITAIQHQKVNVPVIRRSLFREFYGLTPQTREVTSSGTGVIVQREDDWALILTNYHVINSANEIHVRIPALQKDYPATLIRSDAEADLAVLAITVGEDEVTVAEVGDPNELQVGQWVLAIGNPFGLSNTVTQGIVSAIDRVLPVESQYHGYIQTSAAINHGNSGGPLITLDGKVVGINAVVINPTANQGTAAFAGIGLAIPISIPRINSLLKTGQVGYVAMGVVGQSTAPEGGFLVETVYGKQAEAAGLQPGDIIKTCAGTKVNSMDDLNQILATLDPDERFQLVIMRDGQELTLDMIAELEDYSDAPNWSGLRVGPLDNDARSKNPYLARAQGVLVEEVLPGSSAADAHFQPGDLIVRINNMMVTNPMEFSKAMAALDNADILYMVVQRANRIHLVRLYRKK